MDQTHSILFYFHLAARPSRHRRRRRRPRANEAQRRRRGRRTCRRPDVASRRRTSCAVARRLLLVTGQEIDNALKCMPMCRWSRACDGRNKESWCTKLDNNMSTCHGPTDISFYVTMLCKYMHDPSLELYSQRVRGFGARAKGPPVLGSG